MDSHPLDLSKIAGQLEALEETIIHKLIDRAQFCVNTKAYQAGESGFSGEDLLSLFEVRLKYHEQMDALFGRFEVPEERPFTARLPSPRRAVITDSSAFHLVDFNEINLTVGVREAYTSLVPELCPVGDDGQYGSSVEHDVIALQAISRRIHYGALYVAESKYLSDKTHFNELIRKGDRDQLANALTRMEVEEKIIRRVPDKVRRIQREADQQLRKLISPELVGQFYRDTVIPLTKQGEVSYLMLRKPI